MVMERRTVVVMIIMEVMLEMIMLEMIMYMMIGSLPPEDGLK